MRRYLKILFFVFSIILLRINSYGKNENINSNTAWAKTADMTAELGNISTKVAVISSSEQTANDIIALLKAVQATTDNIVIEEAGKIIVQNGDEISTITQTAAAAIVDGVETIDDANKVLQQAFANDADALSAAKEQAAEDIANNPDVIKDKSWLVNIFSIGRCPHRPKYVAGADTCHEKKRAG